MKLVVVESPAKAKTIEKYLGPGHRVLASYGHVRDLPAKDGSVDPDKGFEMLWTNSVDRAKQLKAIADGMIGQMIMSQGSYHRNGTEGEWNWPIDAASGTA